MATGRWLEGMRTIFLLAVLLEVGIIGAIPYLVGLWLCAQSAWRARVGGLGLLPLALLSTVLACGMSGNILRWKTQWLVSALALASALLRALPIGSENECLLF